MAIERKWERLMALLGEMKLAVLAYSGGVDSSLLLRASAEAMGLDIIAVTAVSRTYPEGEIASAQAFARALGTTHRILHTDELNNEKFALNAADRCYFCKKELFSKLREIADSEGIRHVIDGTNADDLKDDRPGIRAARESGVRSPLMEAGITKSEIREKARELDLPVWDKPSLACLASRIPYGMRITRDLLDRIQAAEDIVRGLGFRQVRVRHHGDTARIEVGRDEFGRLLTDGLAGKIASSLKDLGYIYVCLDLEGYRTGSMNEGLGRMRNAECGMKKRA